MRNCPDRQTKIRNALQVLAQKEGLQQKQLLELLNGKLKILKKSWGIDTSDIDSVRLAIHAHFVAHLEQLAVPIRRPQGRDVLPINHRKTQFRRVVLVLFNVLPSLPNKESLILSERYAWLDSEANCIEPNGVCLRINAAAARRDFNYAIDRIAGTLARRSELDYEVDSKQAVPELIPNTIATSITELSVIDRRAYVDEVLSHVMVGRRIISIWGEAGTGKSTLANLIAEEIADGRPVALLRMGDEKALQHDVVDALITEGLRPEAWDGTASRVMLKRRFAEPVNIAAVIVDNVNNDEDVWNLIPTNPTIPIILTSRTPPQHSDIVGVELGEFSAEEAQLFIKRALQANTNELDRFSLTVALGRRPLALDHAVRFLNEVESVSIGDVVNAFADSMTKGLGLIELSVDQSSQLVRLYELILESVLTDDASQAVLDAFIAATGNSALCFPKLLTFTMRVAFPDTMTEIRLASGLRRLRSYGLVRKDKDFWTMHPLTWKILRELRGKALNGVIRKHLEAISDPLLTKADAQEHGVSSVARIYYHEIRATIALYSEWKWVLWLDLHTWVGLRVAKDAAGEVRPSYFRYDVFPDGVRLHDYATGERRFIDPEEERQFSRIIELVGILVPAAHLLTLRGVDPDRSDFPLRLLEYMVENGSVGTLQTIVMMNKYDPPILYTHEKESRSLALKAASRMREIMAEDERYDGGE